MLRWRPRHANAARTLECASESATQTLGSGFWAYNGNGGLRAGTNGALDNRGRVDGANYLADVHYSTEDDIEDWELQAHASFLHTDTDANIFNFPAGALLPISADEMLQTNHVG